MERGAGRWGALSCRPPQLPLAVILGGFSEVLQRDVTKTRRSSNSIIRNHFCVCCKFFDLRFRLRDHRLLTLTTCFVSNSWLPLDILQAQGLAPLPSRKRRAGSDEDDNEDDGELPGDSSAGSQSQSQRRKRKTPPVIDLAIDESDDEPGPSGTQSEGDQEMEFELPGTVSRIRLWLAFTGSSVRLRNSDESLMILFSYSFHVHPA